MLLSSFGINPSYELASLVLYIKPSFILTFTPNNLGSYSENPISFRYMMGVDALELLKIAFKCVAIESVSRKEQKHVSYVDP